MSVKLSTEQLLKDRQWAVDREAQKPHYTEFGNSPKMLLTCDVYIALIDEVLEARKNKPAHKLTEENSRVFVYDDNTVDGDAITTTWFIEKYRGNTKLLAGRSIWAEFKTKMIADYYFPRLGPWFDGAYYLEGDEKIVLKSRDFDKAKVNLA